jgi:hypothetical protein
MLTQIPAELSGAVKPVALSSGKRIDVEIHPGESGVADVACRQMRAADKNFAQLAHTRKPALSIQ